MFVDVRSGSRRSGTGHSAQTPDGNTTEMSATVAGIEAPGGQRLAVGQEGHVKATTSTFSRLRAPVSLIGPSRAVADTSVDKTAWARAGQGSKGFGLLGAGAAQASATTAIGFGYFGGAMNVYDVFFAGGSNVELPVNTPLFLRMDEKAQPSGGTDPQQKSPQPISRNIDKSPMEEQGQPKGAALFF